MNAEADKERWSRWRLTWAEDPVVGKLVESGALQKVVKMLEGRRRVAPFESELQPLDVFIVHAVQFAMHPPDVAETMTHGERKKLAAKIVSHCHGLKEALSPFQDSKSGMRWPFQPMLDRLALETSISYQERLAEEDIGLDDDTANRTRFAIYHLLMDRLDDVFETLIESANWFESTETLVKKPNDENAPRLRFIRALNKKFCVEFRSPCRAAVLELASAYFDCGDLDEAAISKLAPFYRPEPMEMPRETVEFMIRYHTERGDPTYLERLLEHVEAESKWGMGRESSAE